MKTINNTAYLLTGWDNVNLKKTEVIGYFSSIEKALNTISTDWTEFSKKYALSQPIEAEIEELANSNMIVDFKHTPKRDSLYSLVGIAIEESWYAITKIEIL